MPPKHTCIERSRNKSSKHHKALILWLLAFCRRWCFRDFTVMRRYKYVAKMTFQSGLND